MVMAEEAGGRQAKRTRRVECGAATMEACARTGRPYQGAQHSMSVTFTLYTDQCFGLRCNCRQEAFPDTVNQSCMEWDDEVWDFTCVHKSLDFNVSNVNAGSVLGGLRLMPETSESLCGTASPSYILAELDRPFCAVPQRYQESLRRLALGALELRVMVGWA